MKQWLHKKPMRPMQKPMPREMELPSGISNQAMLSMLESQGMQTAPRPASGGTPLDEAMRVKFERQFGLPMGDVRVHHNSDEPAKFGAGAYTYGTDVFIRPGQEKLLNHEMTHVAQQELGQVRPTGIEHGMAVNRSPVLEHSADMGTVPQMAGGATSPVVQCAEGERTQEIIDEKLREMAQPPLPAGEHISYNFDKPQDMFNGIFPPSDRIPGKISFNPSALKEYLKEIITSISSTYKEQNYSSIVDSLTFCEISEDLPDKTYYNNGTAYYDDEEKIRYRTDSAFYRDLPQLDDDYTAMKKELGDVVNITKEEYGFLAAMLHEVGHAIQRRRLGHKPGINIGVLPHEYHNILMHENRLPFRNRYHYFGDKVAADEFEQIYASLGSPEPKMSQQEFNFLQLHGILMYHLKNSDALTKFAPIFSDFLHLRQYIQNPPPKKPSLPSPPLLLAPVTPGATPLAPLAPPAPLAPLARPAPSASPTSSQSLSKPLTTQKPVLKPVLKSDTVAKETAREAARKQAHRDVWGFRMQYRSKPEELAQDVSEQKCLEELHKLLQPEASTQGTPGSSVREENIQQNVIIDVLSNYGRLDEKKRLEFLWDFLASLFYR